MWLLPLAGERTIIYLLISVRGREVRTQMQIVTWHKCWYACQMRTDALLNVESVKICYEPSFRQTLHWGKTSCFAHSGPHRRMQKILPDHCCCYDQLCSQSWFSLVWVVLTFWEFRPASALTSSWLDSGSAITPTHLSTLTLTDRWLYRKPKMVVSFEG